MHYSVWLIGSPLSWKVVISAHFTDSQPVPVSIKKSALQLITSTIIPNFTLIAMYPLGVLFGSPLWFLIFRLVRNTHYVQ
jgi:hypothetical protein